MARKRGSRFRRVIDAQEQLESIEEAQKACRAGKRQKPVVSITKCKQRLRNTFRKIRRREDAPEEYEQ